MISDTPCLQIGAQAGKPVVPFLRSRHPPGHVRRVGGDPKGDHYGRVSVNAPDARVEKQCRRMGERFAALAKKVAGSK